MEAFVGADRSGERHVRESVEAAHRALEVLFGRTRDAFAARDVPLARERFTELREALETHFEQEDRLYYPTIRALRPESREALARISAGHAEYRSAFAAIDACLAEGDLAGAAARFEEFARSFARHEEAEESLLRDVERSALATG
jgi:hypothetical protein